jgi:hypothetical protein
VTMHDPDVTQALGAEVESMTLFNDWMLSNVKIPDRTKLVQEAVHRVTAAHRRVISAHRIWSKYGCNKTEMLAACSAFDDLVSSLIH